MIRNLIPSLESNGWRQFGVNLTCPIVSLWNSVIDYASGAIALGAKSS